MDSQDKRILRALQAGECLTALTALERFGCMRLGARIHALREKGWPIRTEMITVKTKRIALYSLPRQPGLFNRGNEV